MKTLSVIIPSYNEERNVENTARTIAGVLGGRRIPYEIIFVSDGSKDGTFRQIDRLSRRDGAVKGLEFSRNFGKEARIFAGLRYASGDAAVIMDCDLQHPPRVIPEMYRLWQEGRQIVEGKKKDRGKESFLYKISAGLFYRLMSRMMGMDISASSDFKLLDRTVIDFLLGLPEKNTFFRALTFWSGFETARVEYETGRRVRGESKWSPLGLIKYAVTNISSFSTAPLYFVTAMGAVSVLGGIILSLQTLYRYLSGNRAEGFTTVILLIMIIGGFIMISLGIIGHYIAKIYEEVKGRPRYIIGRKTRNFAEYAGKEK